MKKKELEEFLGIDIRVLLSILGGSGVCPNIDNSRCKNLGICDYKESRKCWKKYFDENLED